MNEPSSSDLLDAVEIALETLDLKPTDGAAAELAREYSRDIDAGGDLAKLGPALLAVLQQLGMTPASRAALLGRRGQDSDRVGGTKLDEYRRARHYRAKVVDPPAS